ncbi:hypothetical protein IQ217_08440 [Synechocystis salina LEGE 00031]|uniref:Phospholipase D-like domain-containing protein n=1 Tax=Synechocystis salina LEGE 00031 TaxID=1828736 RepID=A0ABR9VS54_9SYNC|nr:phospholipase D-like domain-containing protein [Synechocystis salina]MBE9253871.1 hypothetical protein [Synechocystis salina LEGE 00031]
MHYPIKEIEDKIRKYHSLPEAIVIECQPVGYPYYILSLDLTYLRDRNLELLEEFTMKCIDKGLNNIEEISNFLGLGSHITEKIVSGLISGDQNLITRNENQLTLTQEGLDALQKQTVLALNSDTRTFYLDALNGKLTDYFNFNNFDDKKYPNSSIKKNIKKPRKGNIQDLIKHYEEIEKSLQDTNSSNHVELVQVNSIEKVYIQWHEILLVLYKTNPNDQEIEYETFSRGNIQKGYRETIQELKAEGKNVLSSIFDNEGESGILNESFSEIIENIQDEDIKQIEQINVKITSLNENKADSSSKTLTQKLNEDQRKLQQELQTIKDKTRISEVIHTCEIREYLFTALQQAQKRLMIVSPWIKGKVVDNNFLFSLEQTLKRKVVVYIIYGIKGSDNQNSRWAIKQLENLMANHKNLNFSKTQNSHRKQLICDDIFAIVTSFNFLSFRADPNLTYRDEFGVVLRDKQTIEDAFQSGLKLIEK